MEKIIALLNEATGNKVRETDMPNVFVVDADDIISTFTEANSDASKITFINSNVAYGIIGPIQFVGLAVREDLPEDFFKEGKEIDLSVLNAIALRLIDPENGEEFESEIHICPTDGKGGLGEEACDVIRKRAEKLKEERNPILLRGLLMTKTQDFSPDLPFYSPNEESEES